MKSSERRITLPPKVAAILINHKREDENFAQTLERILTFHPFIEILPINDLCFEDSEK